ncbi:MAG: hypothetical protein ABIS20_22530 [Thermoanaerobaculia bacterium]
MSLISDALKRARQEAARQDSLRQGVPYAVGVADPPVRRTPWISLLAGLGAGCILAAAVFALAFFAGWGPSRKPAVEARTAEIPVAAAPQSPSAALVAAPVVEPAALPIAPPQEKTAPEPPPKPLPEPPRVIEERRPAPQIEVTPPVRRPPPETVPAAPAPAPAPNTEVERPAPAPVPAAPAENSGSLVEGQVYTGEVPVPGGGSLKLNGIVFSQDHPIAVLDGRVMGPGESVQGFTLVAIESGRVKLQGHGTTVYLSPK